MKKLISKGCFPLYNVEVAVPRFFPKKQGVIDNGTSLLQMSSNFIEHILRNAPLRFSSELIGIERMSSDDSMTAFELKDAILGNEGDMAHRLWDIPNLLCAMKRLIEDRPKGDEEWRDDEENHYFLSAKAAGGSYNLFLVQVEDKIYEVTLSARGRWRIGCDELGTTGALLGREEDYIFAWTTARTDER